MAGWISPLLAAVLMPLSSLTVLTNALHARTFRVRELPAAAEAAASRARGRGPS